MEKNKKLYKELQFVRKMNNFPVNQIISEILNEFFFFLSFEILFLLFLFSIFILLIKS